MSNILLLYNRQSGRQQSEHTIDAVSAVFEQAGEVVCIRSINFESNPFEDIEEIDYVVVAGGDGAVGYVVDKMLHHGIHLPLGIIPAGTANDFATMLGIPHSPREAARHILRSATRTIDCGWVNGRHFINIFSFGLFTTTSQHTSGVHKRRFGRIAYMIEGLRELHSFRALPLTINVDGADVDVEVATALIFNGRTAGRLPLAREAKVDDGMLDFLFLLRRPLPLLLFDALRYLCGGTPSSVKHLRGREFRISSPITNIATDTDGEPGPSFPLHIKCIPGCVIIKG